MTIILTSSSPLNFENSYSVEAGYADEKRHFDHHGAYSELQCPANNERIPAVNPETCVISHMDADTLVGLWRLWGNEDIPSKNLQSGLDFELIEKIDLNGSSADPSGQSKELSFMVGVGVLARTLQMPRPSEEGVDVTELVLLMINTPVKKVIEMGLKAQKEAEKAYKDCLIEKAGKKALFSIGANDSLDPSRPYQDGIEVVVVYRQHYQSISVYCDPSSEHAFAGSILGGIEFAGHPKACGSPRGVSQTLDDAKNVFNDI